jgi:hypothetical protein
VTENQPQDRPPRWPRRIYRTILIVLAAWNVGMLALAIYATRDWMACRADGDFLCVNTAIPVIFVMLLVDALGALTLELFKD